MSTAAGLRGQTHAGVRAALHARALLELSNEYRQKWWSCEKRLSYSARGRLVAAHTTLDAAINGNPAAAQVSHYVVWDYVCVSGCVCVCEVVFNCGYGCVVECATERLAAVAVAM